MIRRFVNLLGGFLRWILSSWYTKKSLKGYFENEDGTENTKQTWLNFVVIFLIVIALAIITEYLFKPEPKEFKPY